MSSKREKASKQQKQQQQQQQQQPEKEEIKPEAQIGSTGNDAMKTVMKYANNNNSKWIFLAIISMLMIYYLFLSDDIDGNNGYKSSGIRGNADNDLDNSDDPYGLHEEKKSKKKIKKDNNENEDGDVEKKKPKAEKPKVLPAGPVHLNDKIITASTQASGLMAPFKIMNNMAICPNIGGGGKNIQCTKGYVEFRFKVNKAGIYYLYIETFAPTLLDNSLWVSPPLDPTNGNELPADDEQLKSFLQCDSKHTPGPLVPHKHITSSKKIECCPKYLAKNAKKGMSAFYSDCCYASVGPYGDGNGCVMDLEMDTVKPLWNLSPRAYVVKDPNKLLVIRLYGREDGTGVTRVLLTTNDKMKDIK